MDLVEAERNFTEEGTVSISDTVMDLWRLLWPGEPDEPVAGPGIDPVESRAIQARARGHRDEIRDKIRSALASGELVAWIRPSTAQKLVQVPRNYWLERGAFTTFVDGKLDTLWSSDSAWRKWHEMEAFVLSEPYNAWKIGVVGRKNQDLTDSPEVQAPAPVAGTPGRPSLKEWVLAEHARRIESGAAQRGIGAEAAALRGWLKEAHPGERNYPTQRTIENVIRTQHRGAYPRD